MDSTILCFSANSMHLFSRFSMARFSLAFFAFQAYNSKTIFSTFLSEAFFSLNSINFSWLSSLIACFKFPIVTSFMRTCPFRSSSLDFRTSKLDDLSFCLCNSLSLSAIVFLRSLRASSWWTIFDLKLEMVLICSSYFPEIPLYDSLSFYRSACFFVSYSNLGK